MAERRIHRTTELAAPADEVWELVRRTDTFLAVCRPLVGVARPEALPARWEQGQRLALRLTVLGVPTVRHRLAVERIDEDARTVQTDEADALVPRWRHRISVEPAARPGRSLYTDEVAVGSGPRALVAQALGRAFFAYRQRRLRRLVAAAPGPS